MRKILCLVIAIAMIFGVVPLSAITVFAEEAEALTTQADESVTVTSGNYSLSVNKTQFEVGEAIMVTAEGSGADWVGIYSTNNPASILWDYVTTSGSGVSFDARGMTQQGGGYTAELGTIPEGRYVIRLIPNDGADVSATACYVVITVGNPNIVEGDSSLMYIEKTTFTPDEAVMVSGKGSGKDWIGIYKLNTHNVTYSSMWKYITAVGEDTLFDVRCGGALPVGDYLLCLIKNDASKPINASAWALITVAEPTEDDGSGDSGDTGDGGEAGGDSGSEGGGDSGDTGDTGTGDDTSLEGGSVGEIRGDTSVMSLEKFSFAYGEPIMVTATGDDNDWVAIYSTLEQFNATKWHYVTTENSGIAQDITQGTVFEPGNYYIRYVKDSNNRDDTVAIAYIEVTEEEYVAPENPDTGDGDDTGDPVVTTPSISVEKTEFKVGEGIMVTATGSGKDWVGLFSGGSYLNNAWYYIDTAQGGVGSGVTYDVTRGNTIPAGSYTLAIVANGSSSLNDAYMTIPITILTETREDIVAPTDALLTLTGTSGYAKGTITVTMPADALDNRSIVMYWADANGALEGYTSLARFKVTAEQTSFTFTDSMVIPTGATRLLVYSQSTDEGALSAEYISVDLPDSSAMTEREALTSFFIISDIHIGKSGSADNFKKMLNEAITLKPDGTAIFIVGDMADNGTEAQFAEMMSLHAQVMESAGKDASLYPLFLTLGNHDYPAMESIFLNYATFPDGTHPTDTSYDFWLDGYHYIFLGSDTSSGLYANLTTETLEWLDEKLSENRDTSRPTFVFLHQPMSNTVSGSLEGEGWDGVMNEDALRAVLCKYPEAMLFNGHTHWTMDSIGNIFEGNEELPIHIFNCASVSYLWSGYNIVTGESLSGSQGYFIEIYNGEVFVRGRDFINGEWISSAQYLVELSDDEHTYTATSVVYSNGFQNDGVINYSCSHCSATKVESIAPMVAPKGYSVKLETENGYGISGGYDISYDARELYESVNGVSLDLGIIIINPDYATADTFFTNGILTSTERALQVSILGNQYTSVNYMIRGISDTFLDLDLIISAYVTEISGEGESKTYKTRFVQYETEKIATALEKTDATLYSVSASSLNK